MAKKKGAAPAAAPIEGFEFEDAGRKFACMAEAIRPGAERWWWFRVSTDTRGQRYAPFRAAPEDTQPDVQARVVAYYDDLLFKRSQPATKGHWGRGAAASNNTAAAPAAAVEAAGDAPAA